MDSTIIPLAKSTESGKPGRRAQKRKAPSSKKASPSQKKRKTQSISRKAAIPAVPLAAPAGEPPISSNIRAALCDSIQYWRAHQGGIQSKEKIATGMLLNGKTTPRDVLGAQVIVTTVGGGLKSGSDGKHIRTEDQKEDGKNYVALKNAMSVGQPIGIVIGKQARGKGGYVNNLLDIDLSNHYNVLDFFFITDIWSELQPVQKDGSRFMHYAIRLQRIDLHSTAWWVPQGHERDALINHEAGLALAKKKTKFYEVDARILRTEHQVAGYQVTSLYLPSTPENLNNGEFIGSVTIFHPSETTRTRKEGLNDLFNEMQRATRMGDVKLQRHPAFCRGSHKEELTSHFSCNMGADYKFGVVVETSNGFETAPDLVMKALSRLTWSGATAVALTADHVARNGLSTDSISMPAEFIDFNEQLMLGYFEDSQISFHDDGEKELGPTVATLSLGSPSVMRFRGKKKSGFEDTIAAGNVMLSFVLEHGDIVIMHGTKIHKYYEHAVYAEGIRRFALTCRYIRPEMISDPERRKKAIVNGKVPIYWQKQAYKGEPANILD
ncbi:hypothetical protein ONZ43_g1325 [Nemania bipapillata]|uniref:Uncharacterized protein n=1 Tax=Nemania bipapillata TaxID=110536 RepID=A0ACC2J4S6_9PEZI|nr:hypothetical protein ONZ43_g1325 [Nemania bipapillata]